MIEHEKYVNHCTSKQCKYSYKVNIEINIEILSVVLNTSQFCNLNTV